MGVLKSADEAAQFRPHFVQGAAGDWEEVAHLNFAIFQLLEAMDGDLRLILEGLDATANADKIIAFKTVHNFFDVVPHLGVNVAGFINQRQRQVWLARFLLTDIFRLDEKDRSDV